MRIFIDFFLVLTGSILGVVALFFIDFAFEGTDYFQTCEKVSVNIVSSDVNNDKIIYGVNVLHEDSNYDYFTHIESDNYLTVGNTYEMYKCRYGFTRRFFIKLKKPKTTETKFILI
jgi:hypothetical protein